MYSSNEIFIHFPTKILHDYTTSAFHKLDSKEGCFGLFRFGFGGEVGVEGVKEKVRVGWAVLGWAVLWRGGRLGEW